MCMIENKTRTGISQCVFSQISSNLDTQVELKPTLNMLKDLMKISTTKEIRERPLMIWGGGPGGNREKKNSRGPSPEKKKFFSEAVPGKQKFLVEKFLRAPPQINNGRPLNLYESMPKRLCVTTSHGITRK